MHFASDTIKQDNDSLIQFITLKYLQYHHFNDNDIITEFHFHTNQSSFVFIPVRREQQPDQNENKNETEKVADIPPGLGGTNVRFPSKFLNICS